MELDKDQREIMLFTKDLYLNGIRRWYIKVLFKRNLFVLLLLGEYRDTKGLGAVTLKHILRVNIEDTVSANVVVTITL